MTRTVARRSTLAADHRRSRRRRASTACSTSPTTWPRSTAARSRRCRRCAARRSCNVFFEDSTRTRLSFDTAAKRLSADTMTFAASQSSINKGESLRDTIETIAAMGVDAFVVRHQSSGAPQLIAGWTKASVINAGDGWHAHPTQAPARLLHDPHRAGPHGRLRRAAHRHRRRRQAQPGRPQRRRGVPPARRARHPRGARARCCRRTPANGSPIDVTDRLDDVIADIDVLYLLRMQQERMNEALVPNLREYTTRFGLTPERAARLGPQHARSCIPGR